MSQGHTVSKSIQSYVKDYDHVDDRILTLVCEGTKHSASIQRIQHHIWQSMSYTIIQRYVILKKCGQAFYTNTCKF